MKVKTLAMIKMEKNFIAHIEKQYPRQPYRCYMIGQLIDRLGQELEELIAAYEKLDYYGARQECADLSNLVDYIFEALTLKAEQEQKNDP